MAWGLRSGRKKVEIRVRDCEIAIGEVIVEGRDVIGVSLPVKIFVDGITDFPEIFRDLRDVGQAASG